MKNSYEELKAKRQAEFNTFPLGFAFSQKQFEEMMLEWGLQIDDYDKIYSLPGGGFLRKSDEAAFDEMIERLDKAHEEAMANDKDGTGYIYDMFSTELADHEYGYTYELDETLDALNLTLDQIKKRKNLRAGLNKALRKYYDYDFKV